MDIAEVFRQLIHQSQWPSSKNKQEALDVVDEEFPQKKAEREKAERANETPAEKAEREKAERERTERERTERANEKGHRA